MSTPIPKDVMAAAMRALMVNQPEMVESVARALLARDERAAKMRPAVRYAPAHGQTLDVMRHLIPVELSRLGDVRLMWVNEGDICMSGNEISSARDRSKT